MEKSEKLNFSQLRYQYIAVICVNMLGVSQGYSIGWVTPSLQILRSENSPLESGPITLLETTLLGFLPCVGSFFGTILFSIISKHLGIIASITLLSIPNMAFWTILIQSNSINMILLGQLITGMTYGGMHLCVPLFVAEMADPRIRGFLGSILNLSITFGMLCAYITGAFLDYSNVPLIILPFPVIFLLSMIILPETPSSLLRQNKIEAAKKSIQFYNNGNDSSENGFDVDAEIQKLQIVVAQRELERQEGSWKLILNKESLKGLGTGLSLTAIVTLSAVHAFATFASDLFTQSKANFDVNLSVIIVGVLNLLGTAASAVLIDSWGRRKLFGLCCTLSSFALIAFGIFSYISNRGFNMASFYWVPVTCVSLFIFASAVGMRPLPFIYTAEILPSNIRHIGTTIIMVAFTLFVSISFGTMPYFLSVCPLQTVMWTYGGVCSFGLVFSIFLMDETKGKNLNHES
ncbi:facilitated trehalose transporter Tret1-like isoform X2 [Bradysia coprophila]|uniref:facilitated trehalose transporter Tret1-like isoform X2 n=1 Tax=Bradysia coprophila TaxID=38358 RepID=UPI00187DD88C|nr:facilitated trehalose transporter Tret1-like isoform X2 [Bradysia coprophila]